MKLRLISNWKQCWRWYSVQADYIPLAVIGAWQVLPAEWKSVVPETWLLYLAVAGFALGIVGRIIEQSDAKGSKKRGTKR